MLGSKESPHKQTKDGDASQKLNPICSYLICLVFEGFLAGILTGKMVVPLGWYP